MPRALGGHTGTGRLARHRQRVANAASAHARRAILPERIHLKNLAATSAVDSYQGRVWVDCCLLNRAALGTASRQPSRRYRRVTHFEGSTSIFAQSPTFSALRTRHKARRLRATTLRQVSPPVPSTLYKPLGRTTEYDDAETGLGAGAEYLDQVRRAGSRLNDFLLSTKY